MTKRLLETDSFHIFNTFIKTLAVLMVFATSSRAQNFDAAGFSIFGGGIGDGGIEIVNGDLVVPAGSNSGGFFQVLRYDASLQSYRPIFISENFYGLIEAIRPAQLDSDPAPELVVALSTGTIFTYDTAPWAVINFFQYDVLLGALAVRDLNGDGIDEIITAGLQRVRALRADGVQLWSFLHSAGFLVGLGVGQLDSDPAPEVVLGDGRIFDSGTLQLQGTVPAVLSPVRSIEFENLDADPASELLIAHYGGVVAYDPGSAQQLWSIPLQSARKAEVVDTDMNGTRELVVTFNNLPDIEIYDLSSRQLLRRFSFPECGGVGGFAFGNLDGDLIPDLYLGVGYSCSAEDSFYVVNAVNGAITWHPEQLDGPLAPIGDGDVNGDGTSEIVTVSGTSSAGYSSGRVVILDKSSLNPKFISPPLVGNRSYESIEQVRLANVTGDSRPEILIGADDLYNGVVEGYSYGPGNTWNLAWRNIVAPAGVSFSSFQVADVDLDGGLDIIVGENKLSSSATGPYIRAYDVATRLEKWRSAPFYGLSNEYPSLRSITVGNLDSDPAPEVAAIWDAYNYLPQVIVVDGLTGQTEWVQNGAYTSVKIVNQVLVLGTETGDVAAFLRTSSGYSQFFQQNFGFGAVMGVGFDFPGILLLSIGGRLQLHGGVSPVPLYSTPSLGLLGGYSAILTALTSGRPALLSSGNHAVHAITG